MSNISFNPAVTTNATGSFNTQSDGYMVGSAMPDPAARYQLAGGVLASTETLPMFGGVGISEAVGGAAGGPVAQLGSSITRASTLAAATAGQLTGFSVFDQNYAAIQTPQSQVPQVGSGGLVNFYRLGSKARVPLAVAGGLAALLAGGLTTQAVTWDFVNQQLVPLESTFSAATITGAVWSSANGGQVVFTVGTNLTSNLAPGDNVVVSGVTPAAYNGSWSVLAVTSATVTVSLPLSSAPAAYVSGGTLGPIVTSSALPVTILDVNIGNSLVPVYTAATGFTNWNRSGNAALVLL